MKVDFMRCTGKMLIKLLITNFFPLSILFFSFIFEKMHSFILYRISNRFCIIKITYDRMIVEVEIMLNESSARRKMLDKWCTVCTYLMSFLSYHLFRTIGLLINVSE